MLDIMGIDVEVMPDTLHEVVAVDARLGRPLGQASSVSSASTRSGVTSADATIYLAEEPFTAAALAVPLDLDWFTHAGTLDEVMERAIVLTDRCLPLWGCSGARTSGWRGSAGRSAGRTRAGWEPESRASTEAGAGFIADRGLPRTVRFMDQDLEDRLSQRVLELTSCRPISASSASGYSEKLGAWWNPYAITRGLPFDFAATGARSLTVAELSALIGAAHTGDLRRMTREGSRARAGEPLSVPSLDGLFAALRDAHLRVGLDWHGDHPDVRELRTGYARAHGDTQRRATAMAAEHTVAMFGNVTPPTHDPTAHHARARAVALALGVPAYDLQYVTPENVTARPADAVVRVLGRSVSIPCLRTATHDPLVAEAACAHCALLEWVNAGAPYPLLPAATAASFMRRLNRWIAHMPGVSLDGGVLTVDSPDPWTAIALGLPTTAQAWVRARAVLLPMRVVGLRLDDIDGLTARDVRIDQGRVTFSVVGKTERGDRPYATTLVPTGDALCPVTAVRSYEAWVRAHGCPPERSRWIVPLRGKAPFRYPTEVDVPGGSRALYQSIRLWLVENSSGLATDADGGHLTPHSARRGFATQARRMGHEASEIQRAMRHKKISTTLEYFEDVAGATAARQVLDGIAERSRNANE